MAKAKSTGPQKRAVKSTKPAAKKAAPKKAAPKKAAPKKAAAKKAAPKKAAPKKGTARAAAGGAARKARAAKAPERGGPPPARAYGNAVQEILDDQSREPSTFKPAVDRRLSLVRPRKPRALEDLSAPERWQLERLFGSRKGKQSPGENVLRMLADDENQFEIADVVDEAGQTVYRIFAWNYGVGYLVSGDSDEVIGMGCQHDIEHWHLGQRDVFYAVDRALRTARPRLEQPLNFCWRTDSCWTPDELRLAPGKHVLLDGLKHVPREKITRIPS